LTEEAQRVKADYYDVWSNIFKDSFFGVQADWCARNNMEYLVHLIGEEVGIHQARTEGGLLPRRAVPAGARHR